MCLQLICTERKVWRIISEQNVKRKQRQRLIRKAAFRDPNSEHTSLMLSLLRPDVFMIHIQDHLRNELI